MINSNMGEGNTEEEQSIMPDAHNGPAVTDQPSAKLQSNALLIVWESVKSISIRAKLPEPDISIEHERTDLRGVKAPDRPKLNTYEPDEPDDFRAYDENALEPEPESEPQPQLQPQPEPGSLESRFKLEKLTKEINLKKENSKLHPSLAFKCCNLKKPFFNSEPGKRSFFTYFHLLTTTSFFSLLVLYSVFNGKGDHNFEKLQKSHISSHNSKTPEDSIYELEQAIIDIPLIKFFSFSPESLIRLGAVYPNCMTYNSPSLERKLLDQREYNGTGCCVKNEKENGSYVACFQSHEHGCRVCSCMFTSSFFVKAQLWKFIKNLNSSIGPVCGRDPKYCLSPDPKSFSTTDITEWRECQSVNSEASKAMHMNCKIFYSPCCLLTGECKIMVKTECEQNGGYYHPDARFCSEVNCFHDLCGYPLFVPLRILVSPFLVSGFIQYFLVLVYFLLVVRQLETTYGTVKIGSLFIITSIIDNIAFMFFYRDLLTMSPTTGMIALFFFTIMEYILHYCKNKCSSGDKDADKNKKWKIVQILIVGSLYFFFIFFSTPFIKLGQIVIGTLFGILFSFVFILYPLCKQNKSEPMVGTTKIQYSVRQESLNIFS